MVGGRTVVEAGLGGGVGRGAALADAGAQHLLLGGDVLVVVRAVLPLHGNGSGRISISSGDAEKATLPVSVWQRATALEGSPDSVSLAVDGTATLTASAKDSNGNEVQVADRNQGGAVVYWSTDDATVATVDGETHHADGPSGATATVTTASVGTATVTARHSAVSGTATVTVTSSNEP